MFHHPVTGKPWIRNVPAKPQPAPTMTAKDKALLAFVLLVVVPAVVALGAAVQ
jgi:hypothetical protein